MYIWKWNYSYTENLNFLRIENLVFDDCDILMEEFTDEVKEIMKLIFNSLKDKDLPLADRKKPQVKMFINL